jgi:hypothetical protein
MKSKKFLGVINLLNFILSAALLSLVFYFVTIEKGNINNDDILGLSILSLTFLLVIAPFNWICYDLHKTYKLNQQLSKRAKILGVICSILFSSLAVLEVIGTVELLTKIADNKIYNNLRFVLVFFGFCTITLTSLVLSVVYWLVRRQIKVQFVDIVAELGSESNS